jgi:hypothetical protein
MDAMSICARARKMGHVWKKYRNATTQNNLNVCRNDEAWEAFQPQTPRLRGLGNSHNRTWYSGRALPMPQKLTKNQAQLVIAAKNQAQLVITAKQ